MSALVVAHPVQPIAYGAAELKLAAHRNAFLALSISILIHFSVIGGYYISTMVETNTPIPMHPPKRLPDVIIESNPRLPGIYEIPPPTGPAIPKTGGKGTPVPVADNPRTVESTISSQRDLAESVDPHGAGVYSSDETTTPLIVVEEESPPNIFVPREKEPVIVRSVSPAYPPLALRAGLEGRVYVRIWVDRQGRSRQVEVVKSDNDIFNESAIEAARQFVFTPAYMNNGPVSVWVTVPFTFRLSVGE